MIRISPTTGLNLFQECPRCFWLHYNQRIFRPKGISSSLPMGMDLVIKEYFDYYRQLDKLPPELEGKVRGKLMTDLELLNKWRNWQSNEFKCEYQDLGAVLFGALDDCLIDGEYYLPLDYKTRGFAPKIGQSEKFYQTQLDTYCLLLSENGYKTNGLAYLIYCFPKTIDKTPPQYVSGENKNVQIEFAIEIVELKTSAERAKKILENALALLKGPIPDKNQECEYCNWLGLRREFDNKLF